MSAHNGRHLLSAEPLTSIEIAEILRKTANADGTFNQYVVQLANEIERLTWDAAGWKGRCEMARQERDTISERYWSLQMQRVPGGPV